MWRFFLVILKGLTRHEHFLDHQKVVGNSLNYSLMVKEVSAASSKVYGLLRRDAFVHATLQARKVVPKVGQKASLQGLLG